MGVAESLRRWKLSGVDCCSHSEPAGMALRVDSENEGPGDCNICAISSSTSHVGPSRLLAEGARVPKGAGVGLFWGGREGIFWGPKEDKFWGVIEGVFWGTRGVIFWRAEGVVVRVTEGSEEGGGDRGTSTAARAGEWRGGGGGGGGRQVVRVEIVWWCWGVRVKVV